MLSSSFFFFFFNDTATTEIYTLSLHDALPISPDVSATRCSVGRLACGTRTPACRPSRSARACAASSDQVPSSCCTTAMRSEEHTSELQSPCNLVCRLLLEKKKKTHDQYMQHNR